MKSKLLVALIFVALLSFFITLATCVRSTQQTDYGETTVRKQPDQVPPTGDPSVPRRKNFTEYEHLLLGNPSNATADLSNYNNYLMQKPQFALSYSRDRGTPNWVSWHVSKTWLGAERRQDNFRADQTLPAGWYRVSTTDYSGSGFDRGHNCPSGDRTNTPEDNAATFLMTNIIPQAPIHNRETWSNLEEYVRFLVDKQGMECYVIMGSYGMGGTGSSGQKLTLKGEKITVPSQIWKIIVVIPEGSDDGNRIDANTRVIAVDTPNINSISPVWTKYITSVDAIEKATGYDFFTELSPEIQEVLEAKKDSGAVR